MNHTNRMLVKHCHCFTSYSSGVFFKSLLSSQAEWALVLFLCTTPFGELFHPIHMFYTSLQFIFNPVLRAIKGIWSLRTSVRQDKQVRLNRRDVFCSSLRCSIQKQGRCCVMLIAETCLSMTWNKSPIFHNVWLLFVQWAKWLNQTSSFQYFMGNPLKLSFLLYDTSHVFRFVPRKLHQGP